MVEGIPTGTFHFTCFGQNDGHTPVLHSGFTSSEACAAAIVTHQAVCAECDRYGCYVNVDMDTDGLPEINMSNSNFASVFRFLHVDYSNEYGELVGSMSGADLLAACQIALSTGVPVLHSRVASSEYTASGATFVHCGLSEEELVCRAKIVADVASAAVALNRDVYWS